MTHMEIEELMKTLNKAYDIRFFFQRLLNSYQQMIEIAQMAENEDMLNIYQNIEIKKAKDILEELEKKPLRILEESCEKCEYKIILSNEYIRKLKRIKIVNEDDEVEFQVNFSAAKPFIERLEQINKGIKDAILRYQEKEEIDDGILEFPTEKDLSRYIEALKYEKTELMKENSEEIEEKLEAYEEDIKIIKKIIILKQHMPKNLHKCIGCPCLENDYPAGCAACAFYESCQTGNNAYPDECVQGDCLETFEWLEKNSNIIEKDLQEINDPPIR